MGFLFDTDDGGGQKPGGFLFGSGTPAPRRQAEPAGGFLFGTPSTDQQPGRLDELAALEAEAEALGARQVEKPGIVRNIIDLISRPNFAVAGAVEVLGKDITDVGGAAQRIGRELASGAFGIRGEKRAFGEVFENLGVGELGKLSDIAPFLFSETGEGLALQRGGVADPTGRGSLGLVLDIAADPLTYLTFGTTAAAKVGATKGTLALTKEGASTFGRELTERLPVAGGRLALEAAPATTREAAQIAALQQARRQLGERIEQRLIGRAGLAEGAEVPVQIRAAAARRAGKALETEAAQKIMQRESDNLLSAGIKETDDIFQATRDAVRRQAADAVAAAAEVNPGLLDRGGTKFFGYRIAASPFEALAKSGVSARFVRAFEGLKETAPVAADVAAKTRTGLDAIGRVFNRDWITRNIPGFNLMKDAHLESAGYIAGRIVGQVEVSDAMRWVDKQKLPVWMAIVKATEKGDLSALAKLDPRATTVARELRKHMDDMAVEEVRLGFWDQDAKLATIDRQADFLQASLDPRVLEKRVSREFARHMPKEWQVVTASPIRIAPTAAVRRQLEAAFRRELKNVPTELVERQRLRNLDEVRFFKRRGFDIVEDEPGKFFAYRVKPPKAAAQKKSLAAIEEISRKLKELDTPRVESLARPGDMVTVRKVATPSAERVASIQRRLVELADERTNVENFVGRLRENYVSHYYENTAEEISGAISLFKNRPINLSTLARHQEERVFDTLEQAVEVSTRLNRANPQYPILRPVWNPVEIIERRARAHAQAISMDSWYKTIASEFGEDLPEKIADVMRMVEPTYHKMTGRFAREFDSITEAVERGGTKVEFVRGLSKDGRTEFLRQRMLRVKDRGELGNFLNKYSEFADDLPTWGGLNGLHLDGVKWTEVNIPQFGGKAVPVEIAKDLQDMEARVLNGTELGPLLNTWDKLNNTFKTFVTVYFPAFNFRNAYSNVAQSFLDVGVGALSPRLHRETIRILAGKEGVFRDANGIAYGYGELRTMMDKIGVTTSVRAFTEQTGRSKAFGQAIEKVPRKIAAAIENEARGQLFLNHLRRGDDPLLAVQKVKEFLFDYNDLSRVEKEVFRRLIPFYTWTKKNIALQAKALAKTPGRVAAEVKPFRGREEENGSMVQYEGEALKIRLDRDGRTVRMITGVDLPLRGIDNIWKGTLSETFRTNMGMVTPLIKTPVEAFTGVNLFTGRGLTRVQSASFGRLIEHTPKKMRDFFGYKKETDAAGRPKYSFDGERVHLLLQTLITNRFVSTSDRAFRDYLQDDNWRGLFIDLATGLRQKDLNLDEQQQRRVARRIKLLEEALVRRGARSEFTKRFEPKVKEGQLPPEF